VIKRVWNRSRMIFRAKTGPTPDPEAEIGRAIDHARQQDQQLRNQTAKIIAHRARLEGQIYEEADQSGQSEQLSALRSQYGLATDSSEQAKQAVLQNAQCLEETTFECFELADKVEKARMRERLNRAVTTMSAPIELDTASLSRIDDEISKRVTARLENGLSL